MNSASLFGERLRSQRKQKRLNQAEAAKTCGVSREMWGRYERGEAMPGSDVFTLMGQMGFDTNHLMTGVTTRDAAVAAAAQVGQTAREGLRALGERPSQPSTGDADLQAGDAASDEEKLLAAYRKCGPANKAAVLQITRSLATNTSEEGRIR